MPLQLRRGTDSNRLSITPVVGEPIFTTDTKKLFIGDGSTVGGITVSGIDSAQITSIIDSNYIVSIIDDSSLTIDGNGSTGGVTISDGLVGIKTGTGNVAAIDF